MKEYGIYERQGSGTPYILHTFNNIDNAKNKLFEMISLEEERQRPYFVDNNFYINKYKMVGKLKYYCIMERDITEWSSYTEEDLINKTDNKIIFLKNFKKVLTK